MTHFHVDLPALDGTISDLEAFESAIDRALGDLDRVVARLHTTWTGQAAAAHAEAHREWREGARRMHAALGEMRRAARIAHGNYQGAGRANAAMWQGTR